MIGCICAATTDEIIVNEEEMEDVQWFSKEDTENALQWKSDVLRLPPKQAIAHQLIQHWISMCSQKSSL